MTTDKEHDDEFIYVSSAELFKELGFDKPEAEKLERGLNAVIRRIDMKTVNQAEKSDCLFDNLPQEDKQKPMLLVLEYRLNERKTTPANKTEGE